MGAFHRFGTFFHRLASPRFGLKHASFSQEGEDRLIGRMLETIGISPRDHRGFYVDVGAHHPSRFSNTYFWYLKGWRGINIDARPDIHDEFNRVRSRDINLELGIAATEGELEFSVFKEAALNTFDPTVARDRIENAGYERLKTVTVRTRPLASVLDEYMPPNTTIDFMSVDVEGLDLEVLQSNDWERYRPAIVLAEACDHLEVTDAVESELSQFLISQGYVATSKLMHTLGFIREDLVPLRNQSKRTPISTGS